MRDQVELSDACRWYVISSHPAREYHAMRGIERQRPALGEDFELWLPERITIKQYRRCPRATLKGPLFPGYLFARFNPSVCPWGLIGETAGVERLLCNGESPAPVRRRDIERLRAFIDGHGGVLRMDGEGHLLDDQAKGLPRFKKGDEVRITGGPFADHLAWYLGEEEGEVTLSLDIFGRPMPLRLPEALVDPA